VSHGLRAPRKEPYSAIQAVWGELREYGVRRAFLVAEPHQSGDLHCHGLVAGGQPEWRGKLALPWDMWAGLYEKFGRARVEAPGRQEVVSMYCAKYLLKEQARACDYYAVLGDKAYWHAGRMQKGPLERQVLRYGAEYVN